MTLTKEDLRKIKAVVDSGYELLDAKSEKKFQSLEVYLETRFTKIDQRFDHIDKKIEQLI
jgi:hypothetical protein